MTEYFTLIELEKIKGHQPSLIEVKYIIMKKEYVINFYKCPKCFMNFFNLDPYLYYCRTSDGDEINLTCDEYIMMEVMK